VTVLNGMMVNRFTAEDVKFTFDAIMDKDNKYKTADKKSYYENIKSCEIVAPNKVKFIVSKPYFDNFSVVATGMFIAPMHFIKMHLKNKKNF
jgi:ABC-type transport system substrate-binding protein